MVSVVQKMNAATADDGLDNDLKTAKQRRSLTGWRIPDNAGESWPLSSKTDNNLGSSAGK